MRHFAIRATRALAGAGLPPDRSVRARGRDALRQLEVHEEHEAKRLRTMLERPRRTRILRHARRAGAAVLAGILLAIAFIDRSPITIFGDSPTPRIVAVALAFAALL